MNRAFFKEDIYTYKHRDMKRSLIALLVTREMQIKTTMMYHFTHEE